MVRKRKKICIVYCGALPAMDPQSLQSWLSGMSELSIIADTQVKVFFTDNTSNILPDDWIALARLIYKNYERFDGFVVLHGLDNILYSASALSFLIQNFTKPVIFTGGHNIEKTVKKSFFGSSQEVGMKANLINAVQATTFPIHEVALMFGNKLLRANTARRSSESSLNIFETPAHGILARIDFSIRIFEKSLLRNKGKLIFYDSLEKSVCIFPFHPSLDAKDALGRLTKYKGVIIDFRDLESPPNYLEHFLGVFAQKTSLAIRMKTDVHFVMPEAKIINVSRMTSKTALVKFMWALEQTKEKKDLKKLMESNIVGEIL